MTERGRGAVARDPSNLAIGPSALAWDGDALTHPRRRGLARRCRAGSRRHPRDADGLNPRAFALEAQGGHIWRPIAPRSHVEVDLDAPALNWRGDGYFDMNAGDEPLEDGFSRWTWSRAALADGAAILYDAERRRAGPLSMALRFDKSGRAQDFAPPPRAALPQNRCGASARRRARDDGAARVTRDFEDTPFYSRSLVATRLLGRELACVHESLSLDRFAQPHVRLMLPFRMPRW